MKMKENEKKLDEVVKAYESKEDTLFAISSCDDAITSINFTGDPKILTMAFYRIIKKGFGMGAQKVERALATGVVSAVKQVFDEDTREGYILGKIITADFDSFRKGEKDDDDNKEDDGNPIKENCYNCECLKDCLTGILKDLGIEVKEKAKKTNKKK
jgi:hypothetical protein